MQQPLVRGVFQVGVLVTDIDECLRLFCDALGMQVVFEARNQIQPASLWAKTPTATLPPRAFPAWTGRSWTC